MLGLVAEPAGLVRPAGPCGSVDDRQLPVFPGPDSHDEAQDIGLLLLPQLLEVLVCSHVNRERFLFIKNFQINSLYKLVKNFTL